MVAKVSAFLVITLVGFSAGEIPTEPAIELRWDFSDCGQAGRFGPTQELCDAVYEGTNLEGDVTVEFGVQLWTVPTSGLYLVTARGPAGAPAGSRRPGKGADLTGEFHMTEGQRMRILVGQQSDFIDVDGKKRPIGGSGGSFIVRESDGYVLIVAGGGSSGAGTKWDDWSITADASLTTEGKNASEVLGSTGLGGSETMGGNQGMVSTDSASGGGAGYETDGEKGYVNSGVPRSPRAAKAFLSTGVSDKAPGIGGFLMFVGDAGRPVENSGGFGGGGAGSISGGCGGGGGYSGGGGGPANGWGGGGGSLNNGGRQRSAVTNRGKGAVIISFIGYQCCGPVVVYIAMTFIAGILFTILVGFIVLKIAKAIREYDGAGERACAKCWVALKPKRQNDKTPIQPK